MNWKQDLIDRNLTTVCWCCVHDDRHFSKEVEALTSYLPDVAEGPVYVCRECRACYNYPLPKNLPPHKWSWHSSDEEASSSSVSSTQTSSSALGE